MAATRVWGVLRSLNRKWDDVVLNKDAIRMGARILRYRIGRDVQTIFCRPRKGGHDDAGRMV